MVRILDLYLESLSVMGWTWNILYAFAVCFLLLGLALCSGVIIASIFTAICSKCRGSSIEENPEANILQVEKPAPAKLVRAIPTVNIIHEEETTC